MEDASPASFHGTRLVDYKRTTAVSDMSTPHTSLTAAAEERKARLAKLRTLKRKQPADEVAGPESEHVPSPSFHHASPEEEGPTTSQDQSVAPPTSTAAAVVEKDVARLHLSGRNYDPETKGPRLGFDVAPTDVLREQGKQTLEDQAAQLAAEARRKAAEEDAAAGAAGSVDLFKLQPKKPNWDLKRDLDRKLEILNVRTDNAIARMVRERIAAAAAAKNKAKEGAGGAKNGAPEVDDGEALVTGLRVREREEEEEERREREEEDESE